MCNQTPNYFCIHMTCVSAFLLCMKAEERGIYMFQFCQCIPFDQTHQCLERAQKDENRVRH